MNYHSRNDETLDHPDWNQSPQALNSDATTNADLNGIVNLRQLRDPDSSPNINNENEIQQQHQDDTTDNHTSSATKKGSNLAVTNVFTGTSVSSTSHRTLSYPLRARNIFHRAKDVLYKYAQFVGPGFLIAVAYIDPGNYATDVEAGASTRYRHLFIILMSNLFAIFLQSLCIKLGSVTGLNLAENCRKHLPRWLNYILYFFAESAIIATDIAEVSHFL
jgi:metal iron transporter